MGNKASAIVMKPNDSVATVVEEVQAGSDVLLEVNGVIKTVRVTQRIPFGHKFALKDIAKGEMVIKYGEAIGAATQDIQIGQHVHVHNVESCRGRGDKQAK